MRKAIFAIFITVVLSGVYLILADKLVLAAEEGFLGGTIEKVDHETKDVKDLEQQGYECTIVGKLIEVKPKKGKSLISGVKNLIKKLFNKNKIVGIPPGVQSKSGNEVNEKQEVLAGFRGETSVTCVRVEPPDVKILNYPSVHLYGNSKK